MQRTLASLACCSILLVACGGDSASPVAPTPTQGTSGWTLNADSADAHLARFVDLDGATLDFWEGTAPGSRLSTRIRQTDGQTTRVVLDASGRLSFMEGADGSRIWVNAYLEDGRADATVTSAEGVTWRGIVDATSTASVNPASAAATFGSGTHALDPCLLATSAACPDRMTQAFCAPGMRQAIGAIATTAGAAFCLSGSFASVVGAVITCSLQGTFEAVVTDLVLEALQESVCARMDRAGSAAADPSRIESGILNEPARAVPTSPNVPITPPTVAEAYVVDSQGTLGAVDIRGTVRVIGSTGVDMTDVAFSPNGELLGLSFWNLYSIDPVTARATRIGRHSIGNGNALVFGSDGRLYAAGAGTTSLFVVNPATGTSAALGDMGFASGGDLAFHRDALFLAARGDVLVRINPDNPAASTAVGPFGVDDVFGLSTAPNGRLYGVGGTLLFEVDTLTGRATNAIDFRGQGLGQSFGMSFPSR